MLIDKYLQAEVKARLIVNWHLVDKPPEEMPPDEQKIGVFHVRAAMKHFNLHGPLAHQVPEDVLTDIFPGGPGGDPARKSMRQLRNAYLHSLSEPDREAMINRLERFNTVLDRFIQVNTIRYFCP
jgi:hypothetical protein